MNKKNAILKYLIGTFTQIIIACIIVILFKNSIKGINKFAIIIGGTSSATWGIIISHKYKHIPIKKILFEFINLKKTYKYYLLILIYLILDFCDVIIGGTFEIEEWYTPFIIFLFAIIYGGIEEIGWRYTFQPILEEKINFTFATFITTIFWTMWHLLFFYIDGSISNIQIIPFFLGILINSFILATLFKITNSLSICVITHASINLLTQITTGGIKELSILCKIVIIAISIIIATKHKKSIDKL